jgi:hypothetical protein
LNLIQLEKGTKFSVTLDNDGANEGQDQVIGEEPDGHTRQKNDGQQAAEQAQEVAGILINLHRQEQEAYGLVSVSQEPSGRVHREEDRPGNDMLIDEDHHRARHSTEDPGPSPKRRRAETTESFNYLTLIKALGVDAPKLPLEYQIQVLKQAFEEWIRTKYSFIGSIKDVSDLTMQEQYDFYLHECLGSLTGKQNGNEIMAFVLDMLTQKRTG